MADNEDGSSPVIGVILMVSITVILAAIIAAFVFGMIGTISKSRTLAVTAIQPDTSNIIVTYQGGPDQSTFTGANVSITPHDNVLLMRAAYTPGDPGIQNMGWLSPQVGSMCKATYPVGSQFTEKDHVIVTAWFTDNSQQVILDTYI